MTMPVKLEEVVEALELPGEWEAYLDPETGEIITVSEDDRYYLEDDDVDVEDLADWERESLARARRAVESDRMLSLPDRFDVHEWDIMRRFALEQSDAASRELYRAIHGSGAFRMFKATLERLGLRDAWYEYRDERLKQIARDWLDAHGIRYVEAES
jgi:hypothetical protein